MRGGGELTLLLLLLGLILQSALAQKLAEDAEGDREDENVVNVETHLGPIFGTEVEPSEGSSYYAFKGIPYAEPPTGKGRFKDPAQKAPWKKPLNATQFGNRCTQLNFFAAKEESAPKYVGDEDCLFLNVFAPRLPKSGKVPPTSSLLPVMVYIHGGGFLTGSGSDYDPVWLIEKDVILVTINYRLGLLGFLTLGNAYVSGNMGLKDQLAALFWVRSNILVFGGNPDKVTIFGDSSGGMSVHFHQLSPLGEGLYRAGIAMSGTALVEDFKPGVAEENGKVILERLECDQKTNGDILNCLQDAELSDLIMAPMQELNVARGLENELNGNREIRIFPNIDSYASTPFLPDHPIHIMKSGRQKDIPFMTGIVQDEGAFFTALQYWDSFDSLNGNWSFHGPQLISKVKAEDITVDQELVANVTRHFYTGGKNFSQDDPQPLVDLYTDRYFLFPMIKSADIQSINQNNPVFVYEVTHKPSGGSIFSMVLPELDLKDQKWGISHSEDLFYIFKGFKDGIVTEEDKKTQKKILDLFTNFAKHEDPTPYQDDELPAWIPYDPETREYLEIKPEVEPKQGLHTERVYFWEKMYWDDLAINAGSGFRTYGPRTSTARPVVPSALPSSYSPPLSRSPPSSSPRRQRPPVTQFPPLVYKQGNGVYGFQVYQGK